MKKQALLLIALVSCANASALSMPTLSMPTLTMPAMPTIDVQAYKLALTTALNHKDTPTIVCSAAFAAVLFYTVYKFYTNGGYKNNPGIDWTKKESKSDFMEYGTSFPTAEQTRSKELLPATTPVVAQEATPAATSTTPVTDAATAYILSQLETPAAATQDQSALDTQNAYFDNLVERQMEILS